MTAPATITIPRATAPPDPGPQSLPASAGPLRPGRIARTLAELPAVRDDWEALRARSPIQSSNAQPERFEATVGTLGPAVAPYVAVLGEPGAARAVIVARSTVRGTSHRLGYLRVPGPRLRCLDVVYGGILTDGSPESAGAVIAHLSALLESGEVDHVLVNHLPAASPLAAPLAALGAACTSPEPHWVVALVPGSYEKSLAHHSSKHRSKLRRYDRLLCEAFGDDVRLEVFRSVQDIGRFLECSTAIGEQTYQNELGVAVKDSERWRAVLAAEAGAGRMRSYVLFGAGRPIAYQNGALYGARYLCDGRGYLPEFRDLRPGNILSLRIMADLCEQNAQWIDYGFGDAEYKQVYATEKWEEVTFRLYGRGPRARLSRLMDRAADAAGHLARRLGRATGLLARIKKSWRGRLAKPAPAAPGAGPTSPDE